LAAAEGQWDEWWPVVPSASRDESADALGSVDFMRADAQEVNPLVPQGSVVLAEALCSVNVEVRGMVTEDIADLGEGLFDPRLVVHVHHRHQESVCS
jgi:hypothetical protein